MVRPQSHRKALAAEPSTITSTRTTEPQSFVTESQNSKSTLLLPVKEPVIQKTRFSVLVCKQMVSTKYVGVPANPSAYVHGLGELSDETHGVPGSAEGALFKHVFTLILLTFLHTENEVQKVKLLKATCREFGEGVRFCLYVSNLHQPRCRPLSKEFPTCID